MSGKTAPTVPQQREPGEWPAPDDFAGLWADARTAFYAHDFPPYASHAWRDLHPDDPRRLAAALDAAEKWRKYGDGERLFWELEQISRQGFRADAKTRAELEELRRPHTPHEVTATPGWPPVAIPGRPGWWRHWIDGKQVDLPHRTPTEGHQEAA
ncbi:hypothetical protein ACIQUQ_06900 [Streptomyces sp. NPDC101118]|uniref:hypothetical protein n=1 Tax=Streptomyces sp. NPDC101118 TaxID=3366109 RepID=UPI0038011699